MRLLVWPSNIILQKSPQHIQVTGTVDLYHYLSCIAQCKHTIEVHDIVCYFIVVCAVSSLIQLRYNECLGLLVIQLLTNGQAFNISVSSV